MSLRAQTLNPFFWGEPTFFQIHGSMTGYEIGVFPKPLMPKECMGFTVFGSGFRGEGLGFRVPGCGLSAWGFRVSDSGLAIAGLHGRVRTL